MPDNYADEVHIALVLSAAGNQKLMATQLIAPESIDDSRFERIDGQWVERPVATTKHVRLQKRILYLLTQLLEGSDGEVNQEWSITRPGHADKDDPDYVSPDVLVVYPPIAEAKNGHLAVPGFLAVEILSPGQDLFWKAFLYAAWGTKHVWIVNPETRLGFEFHMVALSSGCGVTCYRLNISLSVSKAF